MLTINQQSDLHNFGHKSTSEEGAFLEISFSPGNMTMLLIKYEA